MMLSESLYIDKDKKTKTVYLTATTVDGSRPYTTRFNFDTFESEMTLAISKETAKKLITELKKIVKE